VGHQSLKKATATEPQTISLSSSKLPRETSIHWEDNKLSRIIFHENIVNSEKPNRVTLVKKGGWEHFSTFRFFFSKKIIYLTIFWNGGQFWAFKR